MTGVRSDQLDCEDLASRVYELVNRPAWTDERRRRHARRKIREGDDSLSCSPLGRVYTVSSLGNSVDDGSLNSSTSSVCDDAHCLEDQADRSLRERTMLKNDYADYPPYVDTPVGELVGDASIMSRIQLQSSSGRDLKGERRREPITRRRRTRGTSDIENCGELGDIDMNGDEPDLEGARLVASDVLTRVDSASLSRHEGNGCLRDSGSGALLVLFGILLGVLMSVSFEETMRRRETFARRQSESLPGRGGRRTRMSPPWPLSIANLLSSTIDRAREKYDPRWYQFQGAYSDSFTFCSRKESRIPCPYSVYCPGGRGSASEMQYEGDRPHDTNGKAHVPIIDFPFGWARLGGPGEDGNISENTCSVHFETESEASAKVSSHILCCREAPLPAKNEVESNFLDGNLEPRKSIKSDIDREEDRYELLRQRLDPAWFDPQHGWFGELEGANVLLLLWSFPDL